MFRVQFTKECRLELVELRNYIASRESRRIAAKYMVRLMEFCRGLALAPYRGQHRPGIAFGQRSIGFERRISVIFEVRETEKVVNITGVRYGGRSLGSARDDE